MIIKSLTRKQPSFSQLIEYMDKETEIEGFTYNCWNDGLDPEVVEQEFLENYQHLPKRKNGNALYHEIIALPRNSDIPRDQRRAILRDLVDQYVQQRAVNQMVYGQIHTDTDYLHCHLMISANSIGSAKRERLTKKRFSEIKKELERYKLEKYGEYFPEQVFNPKSPNRSQESHREYELKHRTGKPSQKEQIKAIAEKLIAGSSNESKFSKALEGHNLKFYRRGKNLTPGIVDLSSGKRYRLKTLGLDITTKRLERSCELKNCRSLEKKVEQDLS